MFNLFYVERKTRLELATPTLARLCSTNWAISADLKCPRQESNLHVSQHSHLKRARLPFRHVGKWKRISERKTRLELATPTLARLCSTNWAISAVSFLLLSVYLHSWRGGDSNSHGLSPLPPQSSASTIPPPLQDEVNSKNSWAENETRTRDPNLGKVVLYQLSYFRVPEALLSKRECKGTAFSQTDKLFPVFFSIFKNYLLIYVFLSNFAEIMCVLAYTLK